MNKPNALIMDKDETYIEQGTALIVADILNKNPKYVGIGPAAYDVAKKNIPVGEKINEGFGLLEEFKVLGLDYQEAVLKSLKKVKPVNPVLDFIRNGQFEKIYVFSGDTHFAANACQDYFLDKITNAEIKSFGTCLVTDKKGVINGVEEQIGDSNARWLITNGLKQNYRTLFVSDVGSVNLDGKNEAHAYITLDRNCKKPIMETKRGIRGKPEDMPLMARMLEENIPDPFIEPETTEYERKMYERVVGRKSEKTSSSFFNFKEAKNYSDIQEAVM